MLTFSGGEGLAERMNALNFLPIIEAETIRGIRENSAKGLDANGEPFPEYTNPYKKYLVKHGYSTSPVTLRRKPEDSLLDTLGAEQIDKNNSVISVKSDREPQAEGLSKKRHFMGVNPATVSRIESKLEEEFVRMMQ